MINMRLLILVIKYTDLNHEYKESFSLVYSYLDLPVSILVASYFHCLTLYKRTHQNFVWIELKFKYYTRFANIALLTQTIYCFTLSIKIIYYSKFESQL